jgi:predicted nucleic acid-binding protein
VLRSPLTGAQASSFLEALLGTPGFGLLVATQRHMDVLAQTLAEFPDTRSNGMHDLHTVVLMREHGISRICTMDSGFRRFPFLTVVEPGS